MKNHKDVRVGDGVKQTHVDYNTKLIIRMATREDSGTYTLTAENINGKDTAYAEVIVLGKNFKDIKHFKNITKPVIQKRTLHHF